MIKCYLEDKTLLVQFTTTELDHHVALGSHSNMIDFLEKGRKGMASTFLVLIF